MPTNEIVQLGRAKNAVMSFLEHSLSIPKIYIDADWDGHHIDVLAIDRDGVGDVHAVLLFANSCVRGSESVVEDLTKAIEPLIVRFQSIPAQYKYIASVDIASHGHAVVPGLPHPIVDKMFSQDGMGRIGLLAIDFPHDGTPRTITMFKPERFRAKIAKLADEYIQKHEADWEIRA
jgi:hypothetical protein